MNFRTKQGREAYELGLRLGTLGPVTIGAAGGELALALARCVGCGAALAGGEVRFHDGSCAACGVWLAGYYGIPAAVFVRQVGGAAELLVTDGRGSPISPQSGEMTAPCTGEWDLITGADGGWAARRAGESLHRGMAAVEGPAALGFLLERMGWDVVTRPGPGVPLLRSDREGFRLTVEWRGMTFAPAGEDALAAAANWLAEGRAVPAFCELEIM